MAVVIFKRSTENRAIELIDNRSRTPIQYQTRIPARPIMYIIDNVTRETVSPPPIHSWKNP